MTIVVLNATGAQSRAIADRLERDGPVRRLARRLGPGVVAVDTEAPEALGEAFENATAVVFTPPLDLRSGVRQAYARRVVDAAHSAGVGRLILNTAASVPEVRDESTRALHEIRDAVRSGPVPFTVVQPTIYLDNLIAPWSLPAIVDGGVLAYPLREDAEVSWLSHAALAAFVAAILADEATIGRTFDIGGAEALTGSQLAEIVGEAAGRPVRYVAADPTEFAQGLAQAFGPEAAVEIGGIYRRVAETPDVLRRDPAPWRDLGVTPETTEAWARRQTWVA